MSNLRKAHACLVLMLSAAGCGVNARSVEAFAGKERAWLADSRADLSFLGAQHQQLTADLNALGHDSFMSSVEDANRALATAHGSINRAGAALRDYESDIASLRPTRMNRAAFERAEARAEEMRETASQNSSLVRVQLKAAGQAITAVHAERAQLQAQQEETGHSESEQEEEHTHAITEGVPTGLPDSGPSP